MLILMDGSLTEKEFEDKWKKKFDIKKLELA